MSEKKLDILSTLLTNDSPEFFLKIPKENQLNKGRGLWKLNKSLISNTDFGGIQGSWASRSTSDRLTPSLHKMSNKNQYCVVTKLCGNKINEWRILINHLLIFISILALIFSTNLQDPWWSFSHKNVFPLMFDMK